MLLNKLPADVRLSRPSPLAPRPSRIQTFIAVKVIAANKQKFGNTVGYPLYVATIASHSTGTASLASGQYQKAPGQHQHSTRTAPHSTPSRRYRLMLTGMRAKRVLPLVVKRMRKAQTLTHAYTCYSPTLTRVHASHDSTIHSLTLSRNRLCLLATRTPARMTW
jgi:hypothetical protein